MADSIYLATPDYNQAQSDLWAQQARQRLADAWEQNIKLRLPDLVGETQRKLHQITNPSPPVLATAAPAAALPVAAARPAIASPIAAPPPTQPQAAPPEPAAGGAADLQSFARQAAQRVGLDPELFVRQIQQESGFNPTAQSPAGAQGIAQFMPATAQGLGINPMDPQQALSGAAQLMANYIQQYGGDVAKALAAYNAGPGNVQKYGGVPPFAETQRYVANILGGGGGAPAGAVEGSTPQSRYSLPGSATLTAASVGQPVALGSQRTSQFNLGLSTQDAYAACGPAAAVAFANTYGRNPTAQEAVDLAKRYGWTPEGGMAGIQSEQKLLSDGLGIPTRLEPNVDWSHVAADAGSGNPVIVSTPGHYFYVSQDPSTGKAMDDQGRLYVGTSGTDLKGGSAWMTPAEMQQREGTVQGALYADNPQSPTPSVAAQPAIGGPIGEAVRGAADWLGSKLPNFTQTTAPTSPVMQQAAGNPQNPFAVKEQAVSGLANTLVPPNTPVLSGAARTVLDPTTYLGGGLGGVVPMLGATAGGTVGREAVKAAGGNETAQGIAELGGSLVGGVLPYSKIGGALASKALGAADVVSPPRVAYASTGRLTGQGANLDTRLPQLGTVIDPATTQIPPRGVTRYLSARPGQIDNTNAFITPSGTLVDVGDHRDVLNALGMTHPTDVVNAGAVRIRLAPGEITAQVGQSITTQQRQVIAQLQRTHPDAQLVWDAGSKSGVGLGDFLRATEMTTTALRPPMPPTTPPPAIPGTPPPGGYQPHGLTINLPKYTPPEVRDVIQQTYDAHPEFMDAARRGVISDATVKELADQTGMTPAKIMSRWKIGQAGNAETILAMRQTLADQSANVVAAQQALRANPTSMDAQQQLVQSLTTHAAVQEAVTGVTAEAGRALRQFRQPIEGSQATTAYLQKLAKKWNVPTEEFAAQLAKVDLTDPMQVANLARNMQNPSKLDWAESLWYFNLLSNPLSHIRNITSNAITAAVVPVETGVAAGLDVARSTVTGAPRERFFGEVPARVVGLGAGLREGGTNAVQILAHGYTTEQAAGQLAGSRAVRQLPGVAGTVLSVPGRALGAEDAAFRGINRTASLYALAYRQASQEGLRGPALVERVANLRTAPPPEMLKAAADEAAFRVFQSPSELSSAIGSITSKYPVMKVAVPFHRTPIDIAKYFIQYSPIGLGTLAFDSMRGVAGGAGAIEDRLARVAIGSTLLTGLILYAQDGNMTGPPPDNPTERDAYLRQHPAYSIKIGDQWVNYNALQPFSALFASAAAINDAQQRGQTKDALTAATLVTFAAAKSFTDMPWLQGLSQMLEAQRNPQQMAGAYAESLARSAAFPTSLWSFVNRATDNMLRSPENPGQAFISQYPGLTGAAPPRQTAFGQDVMRPAEQTGWTGALNPFAGAQVKNDPVEEALAELQLHGYSVEPGFVGQTVSFPKIGVPVTLTEEERRQIQKTSGQLAYAILLPMVTDPQWAKTSPEARARAIDVVMSKTRTYARDQLLPQLQDRAVAAYYEQQATGIRKPAPKP